MNNGCLLVIDLECTCSDETTPVAEQVAPEAMEIIEIGAVIATLRGEVLDRFGRLVRPTERPVLTDFCSKLTSIQQADVETAAPLDRVLGQLSRWLDGHRPGLIGWGSWGAFDCRQFERECARKGLANPLALLPHTNLKQRFAKRRKIQQVGMQRALLMVGLYPLGTHHRGLDDALNIARLVPHALGE
jgi:inhibitor of KinA sporulation pathway (predicted exonuclease)